MSRNILVISAHPDDCEFGCGGVIAKRIKEGDKITLALVTSGEKGNRSKTISEKELKKIRRQEQEKAAKTLGLSKILFLNFLDGELEPSLKLREALTKVIRKYKPDIVYTHDPTSFYFRHRHLINHPDHRAVGESALAAIFPSARDKNYFPYHQDEGITIHKVEKVFLFFTDHWDYWEDISSTIEIKIKALLEHKSQFDDPEDVAQRVKKYAKVYGKEKNMEYAEVFKYLDLTNKDISVPG